MCIRFVRELKKQKHFNKINPLVFAEIRGLLISVEKLINGKGEEVQFTTKCYCRNTQCIPTVPRERVLKKITNSQNKNERNLTSFAWN